MLLLLLYGVLLYSETALTQKLFGIGHIYIYNCFLRMADSMTSQNIELSSWDTLYIIYILNCTYLFSLLNDTVSSSHYKALYGTMLSKQLSGKAMEENSSGII
jgi:hypothetical protein